MFQKHWILVANASQARIFERHSFTRPLEEVTDWLQPDIRLHARDTERAPLGHSQAGRAGLAPRTDLKHQQRSAFAQTLASYFHQAAATHRMHGLALVVSNPFLGELMAHLDAPTQKLIVAKHALDLTALNITALDQRLRAEFRL